TKMPMVVPISTRKPKQTVNQSAATPFKRTVATESTNQKPRSTIRKQYKQISKTSLFIVDSGCSKLMTGNLKLLSNFVDKFLGTVKFRNDQIAPILGYGDLVQGNGNDLLAAKASSSQEWLWHRRLLHLNFDTINLLLKYDIVTGLPKLKFIKDHLCSSCELGKAKHKSFMTKNTPSSKRRLQILHMDLCGPMRVESFNEGIEHQTSTAQTPEQNGIVERRNRTLVEAARTMLSAAKVPLYFWAEAIATTYSENLDQMKEKGDACIFVGYSTQLRAYGVYNKRIKVIVETIHVNFDELPQIESDHVSSDPVPQCLTMALEHASLSPGPQSQENVPYSAKTSSTITTTDAPNQRQQQHTTPSTSTTVAADTPPLNIQITPETTSQSPTQAPTVTTIENINQAETNKEYAQVEEDEFINIFSTPVQEQGETSS
ncbi:retrovirus-related pol polyprotein from transposon TNT 1-94, partial [Tanacetum coccineum]